MNFSLIQLVHEQTLPSILPALAFDPKEIILIYTPNAISHAQRVENILSKAKKSFSFRRKVLSEIPSIVEAAKAVQCCINESKNAGLEPVLNFTAGTKPMSIGAFAAAFAQKIPSFYFDTLNQQIIQDGNTGDLPLLLCDNYNAQRRIEKYVTVDLITEANGIESISKGDDPKPFLPLANFLKDNPEERQKISAFFYPKDKPTIDPKEPTSVKKFLQNPLPENLFSGTLEKLTKEAGIIEKVSNKWYFARPASLNKLETFLENENYEPSEWYKALQPFQQTINFFGGGWWEVVVFDAAKRSDKFRDLRWSAQITHGESTFEKDVIGVEGLNLVLFSCKSSSFGGSTKLVSELNNLDADARHIGGIRAKKIFCVAGTIIPKRFAPLQLRAQETNTTLITPAESISPNSF